jgi:predicted membrane metal-binding protein
MSLAVSLSAWLGTAGIIAYDFRLFSPVAILANILIPSLAGLITVCGFGLVLVNLLCPYLTLSFASVNESLVTILVRFNSLILRLPYGCFALP